MKKFILAVSTLCLGILVNAQAQGLDLKPKTAEAVTMMERSALWFSTSNAAALAVDTLAQYGTLEMRYNGGSGDLRKQQTAQSFNDVSFYTDGAAKIGGFRLWGDFEFQNNFEKGSRYNTILYEVFEDMPYYAVDTAASGWTKQAYLMSAKVSSPVLWDHVSFGLGVRYDTKVGAKQKDPRCEVYKYDVSVFPSVAAVFGSNTVGLYGVYTHGFERSVPGNENYRKSQMVFLSKGLGEGILTKVGDNDGLKTCYYKANTFGGGLQYGYKGGFNLLADLGFTMTKQVGEQNPMLPKSLGNIERINVTADVRAEFGSERQHSVGLQGLLRSTNGIELLQSLSTEAFNQSWVTIGENAMTLFNYVDAGLSYDFFGGRNAATGYSWNAGADLAFTMRDYSYSLPEATLDASSLLATVRGAKQLTFSETTLLLGAKAGYNVGLGGEYIYNNGTKTQWLQDFYRSDLVFFTDSYLIAGLTVGSSFPLGSRIRGTACADASYATVLGESRSRILANISFGIVF